MQFLRLCATVAYRQMGKKSSHREEILQLLRDGESIASIRLLYPSVNKGTIWRWQQEVRSEILTPEPELRSIDEPVVKSLERELKDYDPTLLERRKLVWTLHCLRFSRSQIATQIVLKFNLEHYDATTVYRDIQYSYSLYQDEYRADIEQHFHLEMENLGFWQSKLSPAIEQGDIKAIQTALMISKWRCQILGIGKDHKISIDASVDCAIDELLDIAKQTLDKDSYEKLAAKLREEFE
jgi:hypothetical protein